jgi:hypothetical protein
MSRKNQDVKRQLFKGLASRKPSSFDTSTSNLLSRTLRKQSDKYKRPEDDKFVIHKSTSPEDYAIFNTLHPARESKLQALAQSEQALEEMFHHGLDDSGSEDDEPDLSNIAAASEILQDDILISVPGYSREEITAFKRLRLHDRKNIRLSKVHPLERAFNDTGFLRGMSERRKHEYMAMNDEFNSYFDALIEEKEYKSERDACRDGDEEEQITSKMAFLREAVNSFEEDDWIYEVPNFSTIT